MSVKLSYIRCDLRNARSLIAEKQRFQIQNSNKYISRHLNKKKPKLEFNNKLFIKSLLSSLENKKTNFFLKQDDINKNLKLNTIHIYKKNNENKEQYIDDNFPKLIKSQSYININEERNNLIDNIKSNKKFNDLFFEEAFKSQDIIMSPKINNRKINIINKDFKEPLININQNKKNLSFLIVKKAPTKINYHKKIMVNSGTVMKKHMKENKSVQSSIDIDLRRKRDKDIYYRNKSLKSSLSSTNILFKRKEYLKFLEKKSLSLRANIIVNNIQDSRGGKQELRSTYNPLNK